MVLRKWISRRFKNAIAIPNTFCRMSDPFTIYLTTTWKATAAPALPDVGAYDRCIRLRSRKTGALRSTITPNTATAVMLNPEDLLVTVSSSSVTRCRTPTSARESAGGGHRLCGSGGGRRSVEWEKGRAVLKVV